MFDEKKEETKKIMNVNGTFTQCFKSIHKINLD